MKNSVWELEDTKVSERREELSPKIQSKWRWWAIYKREFLTKNEAPFRPIGNSVEVENIDEKKKILNKCPRAPEGRLRSSGAP